MKTRDDLPKSIKRILAERANYKCSRPGCPRITSGPHTRPSKSTILGEAAHIYAAAPGGKRYDPNMTHEQRSAIENGIWLCAFCARLIDTDEAKYTPELLKQWKTAHENSVSQELERVGLIKKDLFEAVPPIIIKEPLTPSELKTEAKIHSELPKVTAVDLVRAGFRPGRVHMILSTQDQAFKKHNHRLGKFLSSYVDIRWDNVPRTWRALITGLPIVGQDIGSQSLTDLADLAKHLHPYLSKELRRIYHQRLRDILIGILAEVQAFLDDQARAGGLSLAIDAGAPPSWKDWLPWLWTEKEASELMILLCRVIGIMHSPVRLLNTISI
jgi:hypothetical protein